MSVPVPVLPKVTIWLEDVLPTLTVPNDRLLGLIVSTAFVPVPDRATVPEPTLLLTVRVAVSELAVVGVNAIAARQLAPAASTPLFWQGVVSEPTLVKSAALVPVMV